jgi:C4-dicarboxylate-specific signal transduction histidine kinase
MLRGGEWLKFRYRMDGLDNDWAVTGTERSALYEGLEPGSYIFRVAVTDGQGGWNESSTQVSVTQEPFLRETLWFRGGVLAILVVGSGAAAWWHAHRKHVRHLEELEQERQHHAELAHLNRVSTAGQLTSALAHELNQPLGAILRNAEAAEMVLQNPRPDIVELRAIVRDIHEDNQRAGAVIDRLRAMLKKREMEQNPLAAEEVLQEVAAIARSEAESREIKMEVSAAPNLPKVLGDRVHLQQVLLNLLLNAMEAVNGNPRETRRVMVDAHKNGADTVEISVRDTGHGIPPDKLGEVFKPFFTTKSQGMGMGLAISRAIMEAHGGRIEVRNNGDGQGATFVLTLPTVKSPQYDAHGINR